jgi:hypothetical protein
LKEAQIPAVKGKLRHDQQQRCGKQYHADDVVETIGGFSTGAARLASHAPSLSRGRIQFKVEMRRPIPKRKKRRKHCEIHRSWKKSPYFTFP